MDKEIKEQIRFVLEDDNEAMRAGIERHSDLDAESKQMNQELIEKHEQILAKLEREEPLSQEDLVLVRDANRTHRAEMTPKISMAATRRRSCLRSGWTSGSN